MMEQFIEEATMPAVPEEGAYTVAFIQQSIENMLYCSRAFGIDVHSGLVRALAKLDALPCTSITDALAFIKVGQSIREQSLYTADPANLYDVHKVCEWYAGIGIGYLEGLSAKQPRPVHPSSETIQ